MGATVNACVGPTAPLYGPTMKFARESWAHTTRFSAGSTRHCRKSRNFGGRAAPSRVAGNIGVGEIVRHITGKMPVSILESQIGEPDAIDCIATLRTRAAADELLAFHHAAESEPDDDQHQRDFDQGKTLLPSQFLLPAKEGPTNQTTPHRDVDASAG